MSEETKIGSQSPGVYPDPTGVFKEMVEAGVFYGRHRSKIHPRMRSYVLATRGGVEIINLEKTDEAMTQAIAFLKDRVREGVEVLLVGTQPEVEHDVREIADRLRVPYVTNRWLGGTLTNFKVISDRLHYWKKLRENLASGAFEAYTKKERLEIEREIERLTELFGGIERMTRRPELLIVVDSKIHKTAVREADKLKIPVIAFANIDSAPEEAAYLVVGNTKSRVSNHWFLSKIEAAYEEAMKARVVAAAIPQVADGVPTSHNGQAEIK